MGTSGCAQANCASDAGGLLAVIGIYDLLNAAKTSATDPAWLGFYSEAYIFAALV